jgi:hypothetical protein
MENKPNRFFPKCPEEADQTAILDSGEQKNSEALDWGESSPLFSFQLQP